MAQSDFSWFKILSFFGAILFVVLMFMMIAGGIYLIIGDQPYNGVACIIGGILSGAFAVWIYKNYQRKNL